MGKNNKPSKGKNNKHSKNNEHSKERSKNVRAIAGQTIDQARGAMENYLNFFQKGISASPWASTALSKKVSDYAQNNVETSFRFAQKLTQARDLQDVMRIQAEYFQTQLKSMTEQAKDFGETTAKAAGMR